MNTIIREKEPFLEKRNPGRMQIGTTVLTVHYSDGSGVYKTMTVLLVNVDAHGLGVNATQPLCSLSEVTICMKWDGLQVEQRSSVRWCRPTKNGKYRIGLRLLGQPVVVGAAETK